MFNASFYLFISHKDQIEYFALDACCIISVQLHFEAVLPIYSRQMGTYASNGLWNVQFASRPPLFVWC